MAPSNSNERPDATSQALQECQNSEDSKGPQAMIAPPSDSSMSSNYSRPRVPTINPFKVPSSASLNLLPALGIPAVSPTQLGSPEKYSDQPGNVLATVSDAPHITKPVRPPATTKYTGGGPEPTFRAAWFLHGDEFHGELQTILSLHEHNLKIVVLKGWSRIEDGAGWKMVETKDENQPIPGWVALISNEYQALRIEQFMLKHGEKMSVELEVRDPNWKLPVRGWALKGFVRSPNES